jgi:membrane protein YqaA with SNARE-associated domain
MRIFNACFDRALCWARHRYATRYLCGLSFAESVFFPIPPDVMLAPMAMSQPARAWRFAWLATAASVLGGVVGYLLGYFMLEAWLLPLLTGTAYETKFNAAAAWFGDYGVWVVLLAGFSPIPYKVFTLGSGALHLAFWPFLLASAFGRGARFFLVAGLMRWGGAPMEAKLRQHVEWLGWLTVSVGAGGYLLLR